VDQLKRRKNFEFMSEFFKQRLGHMPELEFAGLDETGAGAAGGLEEQPGTAPVKKNGTPAPGKDRPDTLADPLVKSALEIFDGEVIG
jgi:hypothetical protein